MRGVPYKTKTKVCGITFCKIDTYIKTFVKLGTVIDRTRRSIVRPFCLGLFYPLIKTKVSRNIR